MTEQRLTTLIKNQEPYYAQGSPLLLEAHAMHNDNLTGARIAQLKWLNLDSRTVEAAVVQLKCYDSLGNAIETAEHQYDHLTVAAGKEFGAKDAILLPNANTSRYEICLKGVAFAGGESWTADEPEPFEKLPGAQPHSIKGELLQQYRRELKAGRLGTTVRNQPLRFADLWLCACGSWQKAGTPCRSCRAEQEQLETLADPEMLQAKLDAYKAEQERLEQERQERLRREEAEREAEREARRLKAEQEQREADERRAKARKRNSVIACVAVLVIALGCLYYSFLRPNGIYKQGEALFAKGKYAEAAEAFTQVNDYKDSEERRQECWVKQGDALLAQGESGYALLAYRAAGDYPQAVEKATVLEKTLTHSISAGYYHTVGLKADGSVVAVGRNDDGQCEVSSWTDIVAVSAGIKHAVGLKADGTVVAVGRNNSDQCEVSGWTDIVAASTSGVHTVGLKVDGTVVAVGDNNGGQCDVSGWTDIVAVSAGGSHTVGLKADGIVVAVGSNKYGQCDVSDWTDIVVVSAGVWHTVGLKADGTVVAVGDNDEGQCEVSGWTDIVAVSAGSGHTVGLKADGTVVAVGDNDEGQCGVSRWTNIVAVSAGGAHTVGLKSDGTVVAVGYNKYGQCEVSGWKDIGLGINNQAAK